jgi:hypothetical protein
VRSHATIGVNAASEERRYSSTASSGSTLIQVGANTFLLHPLLRALRTQAVKHGWSGHPTKRRSVSPTPFSSALPGSAI